MEFVDKVKDYFSGHGDDNRDDVFHNAVSPAELMEQARYLPQNEEREDDSDYKEFVILTRDQGNWEFVFRQFCGDAVSPKGHKPCPADKRLTDEFGGVWKDQILYKRVSDDSTLIIMLWPWMDGERVTVKIAKV